VVALYGRCTVVIAIILEQPASRQRGSYASSWGMTVQHSKLPICRVECSRRTMLQGLGVAAVAALVPGCTQAGSDLPNAKSTSCSSNICLDLADPANQALTTAGGALLVDASNDTIMVIRQSATTVVAVSAICTHAGCSMNFNASRQLLDCPCHGSQFAEDGHVLRGPAVQPLKVYSASLDPQTNTITIIP
jgi:cytochrome b6-f complex iron-sulfur subunit